jgi:hypothetical protein
MPCLGLRDEGVGTRTGCRSGHSVVRCVEADYASMVRLSCGVEDWQLDSRLLSTAHTICEFSLLRQSYLPVPRCAVPCTLLAVVARCNVVTLRASCVFELAVARRLPRQRTGGPARWLSHESGPAPVSSCMRRCLQSARRARRSGFGTLGASIDKDDRL